LNLFDSIGLSTDPFSTSPNVDLFYPALEHRQCLEGLELAIRMRRGLSVIRGGIGVGKTTISRKLIQNFKDEPDDFDFYLILDPKFESEIILLKHIIELFGVNDSAESVQDCRNIIENYLLKVGVEQGKTLVLIIDEGQNLPGEMLDVFRTLLNFETDEFKLLQLIIFGQPEMGNMIHKYPNFEDRISFDFEIGPISLEDMRGMINHRIEITGGQAGSWFNEKALLKIHKNTQGYPRKVTQLCHQLLLTMISEEKTIINDEMVQRVISGKIDTGGLLKQKKKNYNEIAVNKLLDVLRKDDEPPKKIQKPMLDEIEEDDEWIGGEQPPEPMTNEPLVQKDSKNRIIASSQDSAVPGTNQEKPSADKSLKEHDKEPSLTKKYYFRTEDDVLPGQGSYPAYISKAIHDSIPVDKTYAGLDIDNGRITSVVINENNSTKTLLAYNLHFSDNRDLEAKDHPDQFKSDCLVVMEGLDDDLSNYGDNYKQPVKSLLNRDAIAITINSDKAQLHLIDVPKENQKEKKQIIEWTIKKDLAFSLENSVLDYVKGKQNSFRVGVGENEFLQNIGDKLNEIEWSIRAWYPLAQSVYNAFIWSYQEHRKKDTIIIHFGEKNSLVMCCSKLELKLVRPLFIGVQSLHDSLIDNGIEVVAWSQREKFQVPESFLRSMGLTADTGEHDDIFRPVFDSWRQEIDRTVNGIRKTFKISDETEILLSGSAGQIAHLDRFVEGSMGLNTNFFNPLRNLAMHDDTETEFTKFHPAVLTASIGSALHLNNSVNVLPKSFKQEEILRWANRFGIVSSAAAVVLFFGITLSTKLSINSMKAEIEPMQQENSQLSYVEERHLTLKENKVNVKQQIEVLSYDTEYFQRILAINKFLSYYTPKEIIINELNFQEGWEIQAYKKVGRDLVKVVKKEDEHLRVVRLAGNVSSNSILLNDHFSSFVSTLEESGLFQNVEIMSQASKAGLGKDNLQFELKCVI